MNTAQDLVDHLLISTGGGAQDGEHRAVRNAVIHGYREVTEARHWLWYTKTGQFVTQQISTTATVTSGSPTITVANAAGFVPGRIVTFAGLNLFSLTPRVASVSGNSVTLDRSAISSQSGVTVYPQTYYDLPYDLKDIDALVTETVGTLHCYITPQEWQRLEVNTTGASEPYYYTIMRSDTDSSRFQVRFVGVPTNGTVVYYTYRYLPKKIRYLGYEPICVQGTVSPSNNATQTVIGSGTAFEPGMVGAILRVGTPTVDAEPLGALRPYLAEKRITAVTDALNVTVEPGLPITANVKYAISDEVDCSPQMYTAILSACELWYARIAGKEAKPAMATFARDMRIAMENDVVSPISGRDYAGTYPTPRSMGWHSQILPDVT